MRGLRRCYLLLLFLVSLWVLSIPVWAMGPYDARVLRVIDGDTFEAAIETWPGTTVTTLVRVYGVDTPEIRGKCELEKLLAQDAKRLAEQWLKDAVQVYDVQPDKYGGRVVARVSVHGKDLGELLVEAGLARVYYGDKKGSWCHD